MNILFFEALGTEQEKSNKLEKDCNEMKRKLREIKETPEEKGKQTDEGKDIECEYD